MDAESPGIDSVSYHMGVAIGLLATLVTVCVVLTLLVRRVVRFFFRLNTPVLKEQSMPLVRDERHLNSPEYEPSANDYHLWREQDQAVNQLVRQLSACQPRMETSGSSTDDECRQQLFHGLNSSSPFEVAGQMLALLSAPIASVGDLRNGSSPGSTHYVHVGSSKITCSSKDRAREISDGIIRDSWALVRPFREALLLELNAYATKGASLTVHDRKHFIRMGNQWAVFVGTVEEAHKLKGDWEDLYWKHAQPARALILQDLAAVTASGVGPDGKNQA